MCVVVRGRTLGQSILTYWLSVKNRFLSQALKRQNNKNLHSLLLFWNQYSKLMRNILGASITHMGSQIKCRRWEFWTSIFVLTVAAAGATACDRVFLQWHDQPPINVSLHFSDLSVCSKQQDCGFVWLVQRVVFVNLMYQKGSTTRPNSWVIC